MDEKYMTIIDLEIINYTVKIEREEGGGGNKEYASYQG